MEGGKPSGSSLAYDLFGPKDSPASASSSGIFSSIFVPPSTVVGRELLHSPIADKKKIDDSGNPACHATTQVAVKNAVGGEGQVDISSYYRDQKVPPFHYSSSIYYGGQDLYSRPQEPPNTLFSTFNKDGGEDESGGASRGNWWQGSLYY